jgi:GT2 family glycosyltransferase
MSKVTIIIVGYKRPDVLLRTFSSVQTLGAVHVRRCIIIDNGGCADAAQMLDREHSWVTAITGNGNVGFGKGCNLGLIETVTPLALLLNPDATLTRSALDEMVKFMNEHEEAGIIAPAIQEEGGGLQQAGGLPDPIRIAVEQCCALGPRRPAIPY